ncbi:MAG: hypothetical protein K1X65_20610 [Caldilineales bacterium]|nr:hypothetical protein [Caldilineales bacterium]MCW5859439.1 hypothetical protein [Caldilineales bacterium]
MSTPIAEYDDFDSPWKEALEQYFQEFTAFFFPQAFADIDWDKGYEFLDKELQQIARDAAVGQRHVDKLVKLWRLGGDETWVLLHIEVQSQGQSGFAERMYIYNHRLFDRYHRLVASMAVLGDERPNWRPGFFGYELWGCKVDFSFPTVKLLDFRQQWQLLEANDNPFAIVVMAHLKAQETRQDQEGRKDWKLSLIRRLYEQGYNRRDILNLFRFIDWIMRLPAGLEDDLWQEVRHYEEAMNMEYITSIERIGMKKGYEQGIQQGIQQGVQQGIQQGIQQGVIAGIELGLELKFGADGLRLMPEIRQIDDSAILRTVHEAIKTVKSPDELRVLYRRMLAEARPEPA